MKKITFILVAFCLSLSVNLFAQQRGGGRFDPEQRMKQEIENLTKELKLNENQVKEVTAILKEAQKKQQEQFQSGRNGDREAMMANMRKMRDEQSAAIKKLLTEEQAKTYTALLKKQEEERQQRMQQRGQGQGQGQGGQRGGQR